MQFILDNLQFIYVNMQLVKYCGVFFIRDNINNETFINS